ncbi:MAG: hypothetical protein ABIC82_01490 [bacterium]
MNYCSAGVSPQRTPARLKQAKQGYCTPAPQSPAGDCGGASGEFRMEPLY